MNSGFYKRRRGVAEHIEARAIGFLVDGIHDFLSLKANLVIGNGFPLPAGVCLTSAAALHAVDPSFSERTYRRKLNYLEKIGWLKSWKTAGKRGNYPVLLCRASVHDLAGNEYRVNGAETTDWRNPVYEPVRDVSASCPGDGRDLSAYREGREIGEERKEKKARPRAAKPAAPAEPRYQPFVDFAYRSFEVKHGQKPAWGGKDFNGLKALLNRNQTLTPAELERRWEHYLASTESFTVKQGGSLAYFCSKFDAFISGPIMEKGKLNDHGIGNRRGRTSGAVAPAPGKYSNSKPTQLPN